jgi:hypothetical protein
MNVKYTIETTDNTEAFLASDRYLQSVKAAAFIDQIILDQFAVLDNNTSFVRRPDPRKEDFARRLYEDQKLGIDVRVKLENLTTITLSEKALSYKYSDHNTITIEYMQDSSKRIRGDWFNIEADYYICSYLNEDQTALEKWMLIDLAAFKREHAKLAYVKTCGNTKSRARADYVRFEANDLFRDYPRCVIAEFNMLNESNRAKLDSITDLFSNRDSNL